MMKERTARAWQQRETPEDVNPRSCQVSWSVTAFALVFSLSLNCAIADSPEAAVTTTAEDGGLETIIVTGRKRQESVQDIPVVMTALSGEQVARKDLSSLEKLAAMTPDLAIGRNNAVGATISMRGIGGSISSASIEQSTAIIVDDVYYGQATVLNEALFDLARVEILKGPQALFYGKNATGGAISITTADPTQKAELKGMAAYEFKSKETQLSLIGSMPISDKLGIRVAIRGSYMDGGYSTNEAPVQIYPTIDIQNPSAVPVNHLEQAGPSVTPRAREIVGRATLKWEPTERLIATAKASSTYSDSNNPLWNGAAFKCPTGYSQLNGFACGQQFLTHQNDLPVDIAATMPRFANANGAAYSTYRSFGTTGTLAYNLDDVTISSVSNYNRSSYKVGGDGGFQSAGAANAWSPAYQAFHAYSSELRAFTKYNMPVNFMIGGLYQKTKFDYEQQNVFAGLSDSGAPPGYQYVAVTKNSSTDGRTSSVFGQVIWKVVPTLEAAAGARYSDEIKDSFFADDYVNPGLLGLFYQRNDPRGHGTITANQHFTDSSPEATLTWKPSRDMLLFGAYKSAYKSGGFNNSGLNSVFGSPADFTFEPERARGFEAGLKTTLLDQQLRFNASAYTYRYKHHQVDFFNSVVFAFQTLNSNVRVQGAEIELAVAPRAAKGIDLHGTINYNRARYTDFPDAPCYAGQTQSEGCNVVQGAAVRQNLAGQALALAPDWTGVFGASYDALMGTDLKFGISADARYSGAYFTSPFANPDSKQSSYVTLDAGFHFGSEDSRWEVSIVGKNLTNKFYITGSFDGPSTGTAAGGTSGTHADQIGLFNLPRTVQLRLTAQY